MTQPDLFQKTIDDAFDIWIHSAAGREIADQFIRRSWRLWKMGVKRYGAKSIVEVLRWHYTLRNKTGEEWKINNSYVSRLARFAMAKEPNLDGFFELRTLHENRA